MSRNGTLDVDTLRRRQDALRRQGRLHAGHWLIVGLSFAITLFAWHVSSSTLEERAHRRFLSESERVVDLVRERLRHYEDTLLSAVAAMQVNGGEMTREQWRLYAEDLDLTERYPGVSGIGLIHYVPADELEAYVERQRRERPGSGFSVHPKHEFGAHLPIAYIEPEADNAAAIGFDVAFESNRRSAALRARRLGTSQISGPTVLVQDAGRTPGFVFYAPYYDRPGTTAALSGAEAIADRESRFRGMVYVPLVVRSLVAGVLGQENRQVSFSIRDGGELLHDETGPLDGAGEGTYARTAHLSLYGRAWTFDIRSTPEFGSDLGTKQPLLVLVSGLTIDAMLLGLFVLMSRSNRHTLSLAERLTDDLSAQARALAETNRDLESFAHVVSHDLKTPLRGIHHLSGFIEEDLGDYLVSGEAAPDVALNLRRLREQARRGSALIAGILDYSVVGREDENRSLVDSRKVVEGIGESLGLGPGQLVVDGELPVFRTYEVRFGQVLANLIGNSFKYNPDPEGAVTRVSAERRGDFFRFSVADNGPGIETRFHERVFEVFTTLERRRDPDSSGIGLSIVKKAVERLGGTVEIDSEIGRGSTFHFTWPVTCDGDEVRQAA